MKKISYNHKLRYCAIVLICLFTIIAVAGYGVFFLNYKEKKDAQQKLEREEQNIGPDEDHRDELSDLAEAIVLNSTDQIYYYETSKGFVPVEYLTVREVNHEEKPEDFGYTLSTAGGDIRYIKDEDKSQTLDTAQLTNVLGVAIGNNEFFALNLPLIDDYARIKDYSTDYVFYTVTIDPSSIITPEMALSDYTVNEPETVTENLVSKVFPESKMDLPMAIASTVLIILLGLFVLNSAGHFGTEEIVLTKYDKCGFLLLAAGLAAIFGIAWVPYGLFIDHSELGENLEYIIGSLFFASVVSILCFGWLLESFIVRIKAKKFWETTTIYYIYSFVKSPVVRFANWSKEQKLAKKDEYNGIDKMMKQSADIVAGKRNEIETNGVDPHYLPLVHSINAIASGKSKAVSAQMKSEKMRTELITNVSHDIKTPLTSIISYVDLLSKEDLGSEKAEEYVQVLSRQSLRLKTLLEDLIEASKASSGVLTVNKEDINIGVIINQVVGEYEERFTAKNLNVVVSIPEDAKPVSTDGRHLSRVIGNLFSNISKYSLEGTRVYVDVVQTDRTVVTIKNTSANQLNISSDELMERFVRGDDSRKTEGSGLGLSIAGSLMKLMQGNLEIDIDGDLFKAIITL